MAEIKFSKLKLKVDKEVQTVQIAGADGELYDLEVKQYLPLEEKIKIVTKTVNGAIVSGVVRDELLNAIFSVEVVKAYTNLSFTEKMLENEASLYDILESQGIVSTVLDAMVEDEKEDLTKYVNSYSGQMQKALVSSISGYQAQTEALKGFIGDIVNTVSE